MPPRKEQIDHHAAAQQSGNLADGRLRGTVKKLMPGRAFGFIAGDDTQDYFLHATEVDGSFDRLKEADRVTFTPSTTPKGLRAVDVRKIEDD